MRAGSQTARIRLLERTDRVFIEVADELSGE